MYSQIKKNRLPRVSTVQSIKKRSFGLSNLQNFEISEFQSFTISKSQSFKFQTSNNNKSQENKKQRTDSETLRNVDTRAFPNCLILRCSELQNSISKFMLGVLILLKIFLP